MMNVENFWSWRIFLIDCFVCGLNVQRRRKISGKSFFCPKKSTMLSIMWYVSGCSKVKKPWFTERVPGPKAGLIWCPPYLKRQWLPHQINRSECQTRCSLEDARVHQGGLHAPRLVPVCVRAPRSAVDEIFNTFGAFAGRLRFARKFCVTSPKDLKAELAKRWRKAFWQIG